MEILRPLVNQYLKRYTNVSLIDLRICCFTKLELSFNPYSGTSMHVVRQSNIMGDVILGITPGRNYDVKWRY
jgi:hypothetical protein